VVIRLVDVGKETETLNGRVVLGVRVESRSVVCGEEGIGRETGIGAMACELVEETGIGIEIEIDVDDDGAGYYGGRRHHGVF
jgi:hypothetical protein